MPVPAEQLEGLDLGEGWRVIKKINPSPRATGGSFSRGYIVENRNGKIAYLKALDIFGALSSSDPTQALEDLTKAYNFERNLLEKCAEKNLKNVLKLIKHGFADVNGFGAHGRVSYLLFEKANMDIRIEKSKMAQLDVACSLKCIFFTALGLKELHSLQIAHQDLKPSNIMVFLNGDIKIGDLGRASHKNSSAPHDSFQIAGDPGYAPLDLYYASGLGIFERKFLIDLYLLGSLFFFYFSDISLTQALRNKLIGPLGNSITGTDFYNDLPYIQQAFQDVLQEFKFNVDAVAPKITEDILVMVRELCEPDPNRRGDPKWKGSTVPAYDLQRYISKLNRLSKIIELELK